MMEMLQVTGVEQAVDPVRVRAFELEDSSRWESFVQRNMDATFFHRIGWRKIIEEVGSGHISLIPSSLNQRASLISKAVIASASVRGLSSSNTSPPSSIARTMNPCPS